MSDMHATDQRPAPAEASSQSPRSISERAAPKRPLVQDMPDGEKSIPEKFRIVAIQFCDVDGAASLMEELKTTTLAKMKASMIEQHGAMADNKCEMMVKCTEDWTAYVTEMVGLRTKAQKLKLQMTYLQMLERQEDRAGWAQRMEFKMARSGT